MYYVGISEDLPVRSKNEARTQTSAKIGRWSIPVVASPLALYINTHNSRSNALSSRCDSMRIRIHRLCIPIICTHAQSYFLVEPIASCCLRGDDSMRLIAIVSHLSQKRYVLCSSPLGGGPPMGFGCFCQ